MKRVIKKHKKNIVEIGKFGIVGALGYIGTVGSFNIMLYIDYFKSHTLFITLIANIIGILITWLCNRHWTWKQTKNDSALAESFVFFVVNGALAFFPVLCVWFTVSVLEKTSHLALNISANIVGIGIGTIIRFFFYKFILFNPKKTFLKKHKNQ